MNNLELILNLRQRIKLELDPLITSDYLLLDLPYHKNISLEPDSLSRGGQQYFLITPFLNGVAKPTLAMNSF